MSVLTNLMHEREQWANGQDKQIVRYKLRQTIMFYLYVALLIVVAFNLNRIIDFIKSF